MKTLLKLEELMLFNFGVYLFYKLPYEWWWFVALLLVPDLSILGYLVNKKVGAFIYNFFHHRGLAILIYLFGLWQSMPMVQLSGAILFSHIAMDRTFGYGLKYNKGFNYTHLGEIGQGNG